jgi:hypothetical protein
LLFCCFGGNCGDWVAGVAVAVKDAAKPKVRAPPSWFHLTNDSQTKMSDEEESSYSRPTTSFFDEPITAHYKHWLLQKKNRASPMVIDEGEGACHLKILLIQQWEERQKKELEEDYTEHDAQGASDAKELLNHQQTIATVRKDNVFTSELTEEEEEIVRQRVDIQRKQFEQFMKRQNEKRTRKIRTIHPYITEQEALQALKECNDDEVIVPSLPPHSLGFSRWRQLSIRSTDH